MRNTAAPIAVPSIHRNDFELQLHGMNLWVRWWLWWNHTCQEDWFSSFSMLEAQGGPACRPMSTDTIGTEVTAWTQSLRRTQDHVSKVTLIVGLKTSHPAKPPLPCFTCDYYYYYLNENKPPFQLYFWRNNSTCPECFHVYTAFSQMIEESSYRL